MLKRTLTTEEISLVADINAAAQSLDTLSMAKVSGFIAGLAAANEPKDSAWEHLQKVNYGAVCGAG